VPVRTVAQPASVVHYLSAIQIGGIVDRWDEITDLLRRIERNQEKALEAQEKALQAHEKQLGLAQAELERSKQSISESIKLQRVAVARQAQVRNIALPLIVVVLLLIGYLMVKYRMF
jgi:hypothetical protein